MSSWISTYGGGQFDFLNPRKEDINLESVATSLSKLCRFAGHIDGFYSVAEHCVNVSRVLPKPFRLKGLVHDVSEAWCVDIPAPLKNLPQLKGYRDIELRVQGVVFEWVGLEPGMPHEVHVADKRMGATEARWLQNPVPNWVWTRGIYEGFQIEGWNHEKAREMFIRRFEELTWENRRTA